METFSALLTFCAGNSPVPGEFPTQRPVTRNFDVYFDLRPNKRLTKHSWGWWFETLSRSLWCHRNGTITFRTCLFVVWRQACGTKITRDRMCLGYTMTPLGLTHWPPPGIWLQFQISKFQTHFNDKYLKNFRWKFLRYLSLKWVWNLLMWNCYQGMPQHPTYHSSTLVQVMAWRRQATIVDLDPCRHMTALGHNELSIALL